MRAPGEGEGEYDRGRAEIFAICGEQKVQLLTTIETAKYVSTVRTRAECVRIQQCRRKISRHPRLVVFQYT